MRFTVLSVRHQVQIAQSVKGIESMLLHAYVIRTFSIQELNYVRNVISNVLSVIRFLITARPVEEIEIFQIVPVDLVTMMMKILRTGK